MDSVTGEQFRTALDELLASDTFVRSPALARLLTYLVEQVLAGEAAALKESVIGHVLYGRPASYDPKLDSLVRVSANRLRSRLEEHYRVHPEARMRIVLPKGAYVPLLETHEPAKAEPEGASGGTSNQEGSELPAPAKTVGQEEFPLRTERHGRSKMYLVALVCVAVCVALLSGLFWRRARPSGTPTVTTAWSVRPFARMGGFQQFGAFSSDGTRLAFTSATTHHENKTIFIQAAASEEAHRIGPGVRPAWSPDGKRLAFLRPEANGKKQIILYDLSTATETVLTELEGTEPWLCGLPHLSWSRDGRLLYSTAATEGRAQCGIVSVNVTSHAIRPLIRPVSQIGDLEPAVSPDGSTIAFMRGLEMGVSDLFLVSTAGGTVRRLTHDGVDLVGFDWSADGKALVVASTRENGARRLWSVPIAGGPAQVMTDGSSRPTFPSVSSSGKEISFTQFHISAPIWKAVGGKPVEILDNQSENRAPAVSPDGRKMLYSSDRSGRWEVWLSNNDGSESRPLLRGSPYQTGWPRWSYDGSKVVMECHIANHTRVCVSNADGSGFRSLTKGDFSQIQPSWSHDRRFVYFVEESAGTSKIFRVDVVSGAIEAVTHGGARAIESWDGKWLYVTQAQSRGGIMALPVPKRGKGWSTAENLLPVPNLLPDIGSAWDACKEGVVYLVANGTSPPRLEVFDTKTRRSKPLATLSDSFPETYITLGVLPDGRGIVYTAGNTQSELNMMVAR